MKKLKGDKIDKLMGEQSSHKYDCSVCGYRMIIKPSEEKVVCKWCFTTVYNDRLKFKNSLVNTINKDV